MHLALIVIAISVATLWSIYTQVVTVCSFLHTTLPPWDFLNDFPWAQKYYKLFIFIIGYVALNARSAVYQSLSTASGTKVSEAVKNGSPKPPIP